VVKEIYCKNTKTGLYSVAWDGKGDNGSELASGIYLIKMTNGKNTLVHKALLIH
jgi:flagellar hook assembly protein FlgD